MGVPTSEVIELEVSSSSAFVPFANKIASQLDIANNTGVDILVRKDDTERGKEGLPMLVKDGQLYSVQGIFNTNQVWVSRASGSGAVTVEGVYYG
jgi:hypothetical protein